MSNSLNEVHVSVSAQLDVHTDIKCHNVDFADVIKICERLENLLTSHRLILSRELDYKHESLSSKCCLVHGRQCEHSSLTAVPGNVCMSQVCVGDMWEWIYPTIDRFNAGSPEPGDYIIDISDDICTTPSILLPSSPAAASMLSSASLLLSSACLEYTTAEKKQPTLPVVSLFNHPFNFWIVEVD